MKSFYQVLIDTNKAMPNFPTDHYFTAGTATPLKNTYSGSIKVSSSELVTLLNNIAQLFYEKDKQIAELKSKGE